MQARSSEPAAAPGRLPRVQLCPSLTTVAGHPVLALSGDADLATIPVLRDALSRLVASAPGEVVIVDVDGLGLLDDACLGALLGAAARAREQGGDLVLVCTDPRLLARFALCGLDRAIEVRATITGGQ